VIYEVIITDEAEAHLDAIEAYIAANSYPDRAASYVRELIAACLRLSEFPHRGTLHNDLRPDLRTIGYRQSATIAFTVEGDRVFILGVFRRGQDWRAAF
jgi:toxin ParE1/3/4